MWLEVFTRASDDEQMRSRALELTRDVADLSEGVFAEALDMEADGEKARARGIRRTPAIVVRGEDDAGIRFYGVPGGHELGSLVSAIRAVGAGDSGLSQASRQALAGLSAPVDVEVLVTLSCGFCPEVVSLAHRMAVESGKVTASMIELSAFPQMVKERGVTGVPAVLVNGARSFEGRRSESELVGAVVEASSRVE